jgi:glyoxylase-like metal-dependent hydrolase (beta-lactamase superfamily II)
LDTNCWVVARDAGGQAVVIDPGVGVVDGVAEALRAHDLHPAAVLLTHGHLDHTFCATEICAAYGIPAYVHPADGHQLADPWSGFGAPTGMPIFGRTEFPEPAEVRSYGAGLDIAGLQFAVTESPGHTPGSILLTVEEQMFSGDTLFAGSIGRMDLPGGSETQMAATLTDVIWPLPDELVVHPGHGPSTTIGAERASNPYLLQLVGQR